MSGLLPYKTHRSMTQGTTFLLSVGTLKHNKEMEMQEYLHLHQT